MRRIVTILALLTLTLGATAQDQTKEQKRFLEVQGSSKIEVQPDIAYFSILLIDSPKENISVEKQEEEMAKILKKYNIPSENLTIDKLSGLRQKVSFWGAKDVVNQKLYTLKIANLSISDNLIEDLAKVKIKSVSLQKVENSQIEKFKLEACEKASKNAKEKAIAFAKGMDVTIISTLEISEQTLYVSGEEDEYQPRMYMAKALEASDMAESTTQQNFKNIVIKCSTRTKVEIK